MLKTGVQVETQDTMPQDTSELFGRRVGRRDYKSNSIRSYREGRDVRRGEYNKDVMHLHQELSSSRRVLQDEASANTPPEMLVLANVTVQTIVFTTTNDQAGDFRRKLLGLETRRREALVKTIALNGGGEFAVVDRIELNIPASAQLSGQEKCKSHYDCLSGYFCASWGTCDLCGFCEVDAWDAIDGRCPRDTCPNSGTLLIP